ncbi:MAG: pyridoxal-phosphate dependent enzyme [Bryobacteraceae bacterium]|jgi:threonine dehydratase
MIESTLRTEIAQAIEFLDGKLRRTPVEISPALANRLGAPVWLKLESLQTTGSFKIRGAWFRLSQLTADERASGILTCSAGNHGKGVAYAARELGIRAIVCVPSSVDRAKYEGMVALGAEVRMSEFEGYDDTQAWAEQQALDEGKPFISPFDDIGIMAGNGGSLAAEIMEQLPEAATFIVPVGGGGLAAGLAFHVKAKRPGAVVIGCQHEQSPGLKLSLEAGRAITRLPAIETVAGGVEGGLGELPFAILKSRVDHVALVSEQEIYEATRWVLAQHQYLIEPSAAVTVAACLTGKVGRLSSPAVVVLSGRNVSVDVIRRIL